MASAADRFSRLEKVAIFLIALGQERARQILADVDLDTLEQLNAAIAGLGPICAEEKAAVMLEFARFFYKDQPLPHGKKEAKAPPARKRPQGPRPTALDLSAQGSQTPSLTEEEQAILRTLEKLRRRLDPGQIDWGRAGYDFGEGFRGPEAGRR